MAKLFLVFFLAVVVVALAQVSMPPNYREKYPKYSYRSRLIRRARDVTIKKKVGNGNIFGSLGNDDQSLYGKAGYKGEIFNDARGKLTGEAYGSRVLGANGDSSHFGSKFDWANKDAKATFDLNKQIGGRTSLTASGGGIWNLDRNTKFSAEGMISKQLGHRKPDFGVFANFEHRF